jgi:Immunoglobulin-like domain of bacterial spore germination
MNVQVLVRRAILVGSIALAALGLAACWPAAPATTPTAESESNVQNVSPVPASSSAATALPASTQPLTPTALAVAPLGPQAIFIDAPPAGMLVGSPMQIKGRTQRMPVGGQLGYQVLNSGGQVIGSRTLPVSADGNGGGVFDAPLDFTLPQNGGTVTARLFEIAADGSQPAITDLGVFVQSQVQQIFIDTPPPGTQVGSPMTLTGRVARLPNQGLLSYVVINSSQQQIGAGTFPVFGDAGRPTTYVGSLEFNLPFDGDTITARIYDQEQANGASVSLYVAPVPQSIIIDSPPPGALVGSPMTLIGHTVRFPANGQLIYRVTKNGQLLGTNPFAVGGSSTAGSQFNTQVSFSMPYEGGPIQLTISDPNPANGVVESTIDLDVRPRYQRIDIDTPLPGTPVGSPMTITGRTNWFPNNGQLTYRVLDAGNAVIGAGVVPVGGAPGTRGNFNAQVAFTEPSAGGAIRVELADPPNGSNIISSIPLNVTPPPSPQIVIDTPPPNTQVGSPMTITGRTTYLPNGQLSYRVRDAASNVIGQGSVAVAQNGRQASFNAVLTFTEPPAGGNIVVDIFGPSPVGDAQISASIMLYVAPRS